MRRPFSFGSSNLLASNRYCNATASSGESAGGASPVRGDGKSTWRFGRCGGRRSSSVRAIWVGLEFIVTTWPETDQVFVCVRKAMSLEEDDDQRRFRESLQLAHWEVGTRGVASAIASIVHRRTTQLIGRSSTDFLVPARLTQKNE